METRISNDRTGRGSRDVEEGFEEQYQTQTTTTTTSGSKERPSRMSSLKGKLLTARTLLGILSMVLAVVLIGIIGHMVGRYGDKGFVHVSLVFVLITVRSFLRWSRLLSVFVHRHGRYMDMDMAVVVVRQESLSFNTHQFILYQVS